MVISKLLPQFCIIFRASLFSWLSFKTVIYFIIFQRIISFLFSASARLEDLGNSGEKSHAEPTRKRISATLSCQEWVSQNLSGDPTGKLRKFAVAESLHWPYQAQEHCHFFPLLLHPYSICYQVHQCCTWVQSHNVSGLTKNPGISSLYHKALPVLGTQCRDTTGTLLRARENFLFWVTLVLRPPQI